MTELDRLLHAHPGLTPFDPAHDDDYRLWREAKLADRPGGAGALVVEVADPRRLRTGERAALLDRLRRCNMAVYASGTGGQADKGIVEGLAAQLGLHRLDDNYLADADGITPLTVSPDGGRADYIPYSNRPLNWHTDGYYNPPERTVRAVVLHCVRPAAEGGENGLLDPELAYLRLRDRSPDYVRALMRSDALTIPPGRGPDGAPRPAVTGPVFSVDPDGSLHMRYTARRRNVHWHEDGLVREAAARLSGLLAASPDVFTLRLVPGMGLVCNNALHNRTAFRDAADGPPRLLYRARYRDRVAGTALHGAPPDPA